MLAAKTSPEGEKSNSQFVSALRLLDILILLYMSAFHILMDEETGFTASSNGRTVIIPTYPRLFTYQQRRVTVKPYKYKNTQLSVRLLAQRCYLSSLGLFSPLSHWSQHQSPPRGCGILCHKLSLEAHRTAVVEYSNKVHISYFTAIERISTIFAPCKRRRSVSKVTVWACGKLVSKGHLNRSPRSRRTRPAAPACAARSPFALTPSAIAIFVPRQPSAASKPPLQTSLVDSSMRLPLDGSRRRCHVGTI